MSFSDSPLDALYLEYLDTLDTYQTQTRQLSAALSSAYIALASANFLSPPPGAARYGADQYDGRSMSAQWGVRIAKGGIYHSVDLTAPPPAIDGTSDGLRRRRAQPEPTTTATTTTTTIKPRSTTTTAAAAATTTTLLTPFHPLPPPALRTAQRAFHSSLAPLAALATTLHSLRRQQHAMALYKILTRAPTFPLPLSPLDEQSGFIHLCTAAQVQGVLSRFMGAFGEVWVMRLRYAAVAGDVKWETPAEGGEEKYPHLFAGLGKEAVEAVGKLTKGVGGWEGAWGEDVVEWELM